MNQRTGAIARPGESGDELTRMCVRHDQDVFAVRRLGREIAELAGLDEQDQIRVATALSEIGREVLAIGAEGVVVFRRSADGLVITVDYPKGGDLRRSEGIALAGRLVDEVGLQSEAGRVVLVKHVPDSGRSRSPAEIRAGLTYGAPVSAAEELRQQNRELAATLDEVLRLNAELTETNRGVLMLYNQLSTELEETNRGVVALYAELDEKSSRLRQVAEARQRFWTDVSHELRSPLNSIIGLVRLLIGPGGEPLSSEQAHQIALIGTSAETLLSTVAELLDMAKAESGRLDPQSSVVDVAAMTERLRNTLQPAAAEDVTLEVDVSDDAALVVADEVMLARVLGNVLTNALKFTLDGEVRLTATRDPDRDEVVFTVRDTGVGISPEHLERVFEDFYQAPGAARARTAGSGLGLPYARRLTEAMGGRLELTSSEGSGTTVVVRLPHQATEADARREPPRTSGSGRPR